MFISHFNQWLSVTVTQKERGFLPLGCSVSPVAGGPLTNVTNTSSQANDSVFLRKKKSKTFFHGRKEINQLFSNSEDLKCCFTIISGSWLTLSLTSSPALSLFKLTVFHDTTYIFWLYLQSKYIFLTFPSFFLLVKRKNSHFSFYCPAKNQTIFLLFPFWKCIVAYF